MKVSLKWLERWVDLSGIDADELADRLTMAGLEVEGIDRIGEGHDRIVVGRIDAIEEHPKADRLVICRVDVGDGELRQIACGAKNMKAGDQVPVALPGSQPPGLNFGIEARKVVGVMSEGMLCAADELDLADDSEGLLILEGDYTLGTPIFEALGLEDTVLHIGLTPNRPDCLSHRGVAREVAALYGRTLQEPASYADLAPVGDQGDEGAGAVEEAASVEIVDADGCPRYAFAVLEDVVVGPSPDWLVRHLAAIGVRSVNNIVDVTNFVLHDLGQPLHAFDLEQVEQSRIVVRRAQPEETIVGIDHRSYTLTAEDLVIADATRPVAIAGVMGGEATEVGEETGRVLIECAYFDPTTVRRSAKRHGLHTESSHRFERGIDPSAIGRNLRYTVDLMLRAQEHLPGAKPWAREGIVDAYPAPIEPKTITLKASESERVLGLEIPTEEIAGYLGAIGLEVSRDADTLEVTVPTFRPDLERPIDLIEEIARLHGYDEFEPTMPYAPMGEAHAVRKDPRHGPTIVSRQTQRIVRGMRRLLLGQGFHEAVNYSFMSEAELDGLGLDEADPRRVTQRVCNPLTQDQALMRTTLVPSLLRVLRTNVAHRVEDLALFEVGRVYLPDREVNTLGMLMTGQVREHFAEDRPWDFFDAKGLVEALGAPFDAAEAIWERPEQDAEPYLHPGVQARWVVDGAVVARVGQVHPSIVQELDLAAAVVLAEVDVDALLALPRRAPVYRALPKYPAVRRDFALLYDSDDRYDALERAIWTLASEDETVGELLESVRLFDVYEGEQIPEGKRSLALEVVYRSRDRTLTDPEVADADRRLVDWLAEKVGAALR